MVLIDKLNKREVYKYLIKEGVIVLKKDFSLTEHKQTKIPNLHVWMLMRSLKDKDFVTLVFSWQYYYYFLNQKGVEYLTNFLGLTEQVVPNTWTKNNNKNYEVRDREGGFRQRVPRGPGGERTEKGEGFKGGRGRKREAETGETGGETKPGLSPNVSNPVEAPPS